jgi:hypothetical protein
MRLYPVRSSRTPFREGMRHALMSGGGDDNEFIRRARPPRYGAAAGGDHDEQEARARYFESLEEGLPPSQS